MKEWAVNDILEAETMIDVLESKSSAHHAYQSPYQLLHRVRPNNPLTHSARVFDAKHFSASLSPAPDQLELVLERAVCYRSCTLCVRVEEVQARGLATRQREQRQQS